MKKAAQKQIVGVNPWGMNVGEGAPEERLDRRSVTPPDRTTMATPGPVVIARGGAIRSSGGRFASRGSTAEGRVRPSDRTVVVPAGKVGRSRREEGGGRVGVHLVVRPVGTTLGEAHDHPEALGRPVQGDGPDPDHRARDGLLPEVVQNTATQVGRAERRDNVRCQQEQRQEKMRPGVDPE
jgi:hypothetical protein